MVHTGRQQTHWKPRYAISPSVARALMEIEAVKTIVAGQEGHIFNCQLNLLQANGKKTMVEIVGRKR